MKSINLKPPLTTRILEGLPCLLWQRLPKGEDLENETWIRVLDEDNSFLSWGYLDIKNDLLHLISEDEKLRVLKCTFAPGVGHERHYHPAHFGYTLAGSRFRMKDTTGVREVDVITGSSFSSEGTAWHEVLNIGDSTAIFLIIEPK